MRCSTGNIMKRPPVYSPDRKLIDNRRHSGTNIEYHYRSMKDLDVDIRLMPHELKREFDEMMEDTDIDDVKNITAVLEQLKQKSTGGNKKIVSDILFKLRNSSSDSLSSSHNISDDEAEVEIIEESLSVVIPKNTKHNYLNVKFIGAFCIVIGAIIIGPLLMRDDDKKTVAPINHKIEEWEENILSLKKRFPSQNGDMWFHILSGVKTIVTEKQPSVFLLLHNDKRTSACLANEVGKEVVKFLSESSLEPIIIRGEDLKKNHSLMTDHGLLSETYKQDIERKHVVIVLDLQEIPAVLAQMFHSLCDVENPLVRNAAILFTMQIEGNERLKPTDIAEKNLKLLWQDYLDVDIMDPLITRVTNVVLPVEIEANLPC